MCLLERKQNLSALLRRPAARRLQEPPVSSAHGELHPLKSRRVRCRSLLSGSGVPKAGLARFRAPGEPNIYYRNKAVQIDPSISFSLTCLEHLLRDQARAGSTEGTDDRQDEVLLLGGPRAQGGTEEVHTKRQSSAQRSRRQQARAGLTWESPDGLTEEGTPASDVRGLFRRRRKMVTERHPCLPSGPSHTLARVTSPQADPFTLGSCSRKPSSSSEEHGSAGPGPVLSAPPPLPAPASCLPTPSGPGPLH